jgi:hypothetical protein
VPHDLSIARYVARADEGNRHPGHRDHERIAEHRAGQRTPKWDYYDEPLDLAIPTLRIDTTDGYRPSFEEIVAFAKRRS